MIVLAIDPGPERSAWLTYDTSTGRPTGWQNDCPNEQLLQVIAHNPGVELALERVESFGMSVGVHVFETVYWSGRFAERWSVFLTGRSEPIRIGRRQIKLHLCNSVRATDANVRQALIDRYGPGKDRAVGVKAKPGPLYGISTHAWAALAVAVTATEAMHGGGN